MSRGEPSSLRLRIEAAIEFLLVFLDRLDGDADVELTAIETRGRGFILSGPDDAEDTCDAEVDPADWGIADLAGIAEQYPCGFYGSAI
jgi:hypothetical protein